MAGQNESFLADPKAYMSRVAIENNFATGAMAQNTFNDQQSHDRCYMDLVPLDGGLLSVVTRVKSEFRTTAKPGAVSINGGYVPYVAEGTCNGGTPLPKTRLQTNGDPKFVFTGAMNGCSLVIAEDASHALWGVHYPNSGGASNGFPLLTRDHLTLKKSMDYIDYGFKREIMEATSKGTWCNTFAFFYYDDEWKILAQCQFCTPTQGGITAKINYNLGSEVVGSARNGVLEH